MYNLFSPIVADLLIRKFETEIEKEVEYYSKICIRSVYNVFVIFDWKKPNIHYSERILIVTDIFSKTHIIVIQVG